MLGFFFLPMCVCCCFVFLTAFFDRLRYACSSVRSLVSFFFEKKKKNCLFVCLCWWKAMVEKSVSRSFFQVEAVWLRFEKKEKKKKILCKNLFCSLSFFLLFSFSDASFQSRHEHRRGGSLDSGKDW